MTKSVTIATTTERKSPIPRMDIDPGPHRRNYAPGSASAEKQFCSDLSPLMWSPPDRKDWHGTPPAMSYWPFPGFRYLNSRPFNGLELTTGLSPFNTRNFANTCRRNSSEIGDSTTPDTLTN